MGSVIKKSRWLIFLSAVLLLGSCKSKTIYVPVKQVTTEVITLRDTIVEIALTYYRDTITTPDTISFLSNPYGYTWAETKEGRLHHSLSTWTDSFLSVKTHYVERLRIDSIPAPYPVEIPVYIEKKLSAWDQFRMRIGEMGMVGLFVALTVLFIRRKR